jgi:hypothetical protein
MNQSVASCWRVSETVLSQVSLGFVFFQKIKESTAANGLYNFTLAYPTKLRKSVAGNRARAYTID